MLLEAVGGGGRFIFSFPSRSIVKSIDSDALMQGTSVLPTCVCTASSVNCWEWSSCCVFLGSINYFLMVHHVPMDSEKHFSFYHMGCSSVPPLNCHHQRGSFGPLLALWFCHLQIAKGKRGRLGWLVLVLLLSNLCVWHRAICPSAHPWSFAQVKAAPAPRHLPSGEQLQVGLGGTRRCSAGALGPCSVSTWGLREV